jgi:hypothetical protein
MPTFLSNRALTAVVTCLSSIMMISAASAQQANPAHSHQFSGLYQENSSGDGVLARQDRADFDRSGTRGRMGLGASPFHPEGPGNVSE